ncbi:MAG: hypothetical protein ABSG15_14200 [FCB group bacterium]|jgi:HEPN domain-containing protein
MSTASKSLTNVQLELLKLFSRNVPENDLLELKEIISKYFADKAMNAADKSWTEKKYTDSDAEKLSHQHLRTTFQI